MDYTNYKQEYFNYKKKYLELKNNIRQSGGGLRFPFRRQPPAIMTEIPMNSQLNQNQSSVPNPPVPNPQPGRFDRFRKSPIEKLQYDIGEHKKHTARNAGSLMDNFEKLFTPDKKWELNKLDDEQIDYLINMLENQSGEPRDDITDSKIKYLEGIKWLRAGQCCECEKPATLMPIER